MVKHFELLANCPYELVDLGGLDVAVYTYISAYAFNGAFNGSITVSASQLAHDVGAEVSDIKTSLARIQELQVCEMDCVGNGTYEVFQDSVWRDRKRFVQISLDDADKILHHQHYHRFNILWFYAIMLRTVNLSIERDGKIGFVNDRPLSYFARILNCSEQTVINYERVLEKMEIIYVFHSHGKKETNLMGLYRYRSKIEAYAIDMGFMERYDFMGNQQSILQKYNSLCSGTEYNDKEILTIYEGITSYNKDHPKNPRSLEVFQKYKDILDISKAV